MSEKTPQQQAVALVRSGQSYSEAADATGLTRNAVAGACYRAGVKIAHSSTQRAAKISERSARTWERNPARREAAANRARKRWSDGGMKEWNR